MRPQPKRPQTGGIFAVITHPGFRRAFEGMIVCLIAAFTAGGCVSTYPVAWADDPNKPLPTDRAIRVILIDKAVIDLEPFRYMEVREPADMIFGYGESRNNRTGKTAEFHGRIPLVDPERIDTVVRSQDAGWYSKQTTSRESHFPVSDSVTARFRSGDFVIVRRDQGAGFYCAGSRVIDGREWPFEGKIPFEDISRIEVWDSDDLESAALAVGVLLVISAIVVGSSMNFDFSGGE